MFDFPNNQFNPLMNNIGFNTSKRMFRKAVLGDGYNMDDVKGYTQNQWHNNALLALGAAQPEQSSSALPSMDFSMENMSAENPGLSLTPDQLAGRNPEPFIGADNAFDFLNDKDMQLPAENIPDNPIPGTPGNAQAPQPSPLGMLPGVGNAVSLVSGLINGPDKTSLSRVGFDRVDYNPIIEANNQVLRRGTNTALYNIKNNARTAGQFIGGSAATSQMGAQQIGDNTARLETAERNQNAQIANRESTLNTQIANQETVFNEQNKQAWRGQLLNDAIGITETIAGHGLAKSMMAADFTKNQNFLGTMRYMSPMFRYLFDGKDLNMSTKYGTN